MVSLKNLNVYTNGNFFLEIQSDGSIVPTIFNRDFVTVKKVHNKQARYFYR